MLIALDIWFSDLFGILRFFLRIIGRNQIVDKNTTAVDIVEY